MLLFALLGSIEGLSRGSINCMHTSVSCTAERL